VIVGSGIKTREIVGDPQTLSALRLDPERQLIGAQCSGTLVPAQLGLLDTVPACTDLTTEPWVRRPASTCWINRSSQPETSRPRGLPGLAIPRSLVHRPVRGGGRALPCTTSRRSARRKSMSIER
jgi:hypothetical protein